MKIFSVAIRRLLTTIPLTSLMLALCLTTVLNSGFVKASEPESVKSLEQQITTIAREAGIPSVSWTVVNQGQSVSGSWGFANLDKQVKATPDTRYRIGSVSKLFVGLAVMKLVEENRLQLSDEVANLVPDVGFSNPWRNSHPIRIIHLLEHTTGWDELALKEFARDNPDNEPLETSLAFYPESRTSRWPPGTRFSYSNSNAAVAARVVEVITQMSFEDYISENVFKPLSMTASYFPLVQKTAANSSESVYADATAYKHNKFSLPYKNLLYRPVGAINASANDLNKLLHAYLAKDSKLLTNTSLVRLEQRLSIANEGLEYRSGAFNLIKSFDKSVYQGHDGDVDGFVAEFRYDRTLGNGFAVLMNSNDKRTRRKIATLIAKWLQQPNNQEVRDQSATKHLARFDGSLPGFYRVINPKIEFSHFFNRIIAIYRLQASSDKVTLKTLLPIQPAESFIAETSVTFRSTTHSQVSLSIVDDPEAGQTLHYADKVLQPTSSLTVFIEFFLLIVWLITLVFVIIRPVYWGMLKLLKKSRSQAQQRLARLSWYPGVAALACLIVIAAGMSNPVVNFGSATLLAIGFMLFTLGWAFVTAWSLYELMIINSNRRHPDDSKTNTIAEQGISRISWFITVTTVVVHAIIISYLAVFGVIGQRLWT